MGEHYPPEKVEENLRGRVIASAVLQALLATASASAKRFYEPGVNPPPYLERVLHAVLGLGPLALMIVVICGAVMRDLERPMSAVRALAVRSLGLVVAGSLLAATDDLNDELYQPWFFGSFFLALIPSVAIWLSVERRSWWMELVALLSAVPTWIAVIFLSIATRGLLMKYLAGSW